MEMGIMTLRIPANEVIQMLMTDDLSCSELNGAADQARRLAQWDKAIRLCDQSLALCIEATLESEYCRAVTQVYLGAIYHSMGADDEADQYYRDSYDLFHIIEYEYSRWNEAVTCYGLGLIAQSRSDFTRRELSTDRATSRSRKLWRMRSLRLRVREPTKNLAIPFRSTKRLSRGTFAV